LIQHHRLEQVRRPEEQRVGKDAQHRERLGEQAAAELAGEQRRHDNQRGASQGRHQADRHQ
jgi:hypothetical protein